MDNCRALRCKRCVSARALIFGSHLPTDDVTYVRGVIMMTQCARALRALYPAIRMASLSVGFLRRSGKFSGSLVLRYPLVFVNVAQRVEGRRDV